MAAHTGAGRAALIEAAYTCIAEYGYAGATTTRICARAKVSSGTFFHFFPTKVDVLLAVLAADSEDTQARAAELIQRADTDAVGALHSWLDELVEEAHDPHFSGFVVAVGGLTQEPRVQESLRESAHGTRQLLADIVERGQRNEQISAAAHATDIATWIDCATTGFLTRVADDPDFNARDHSDVLRAMMARLLV